VAAEAAFLTFFRFLTLTRKSALCACMAVIMLGCSIALAQEPLKRESLTLITRTGSHKFDVEIAATSAEQAQGLMYRRSMNPAHGMLFIYNDAQYVSMWMRNTYISLDMVFILPDGRVHRIETMTEPHSERIIESGDRISAALELLAGTAARIGLKAGDKVLHPHFKPAPK
jgi:hypothetical protein